MNGLGPLWQLDQQHDTALHRTMQHHTARHYPTPHCVPRIGSHSCVLYCTVLRCIKLHCNRLAGVCARSVCGCTQLEACECGTLYTSVYLIELDLSLPD